MNIEKDIHPSIIAALNGQKYEFKETEVTFDDGETLTKQRRRSTMSASASRSLTNRH